MKKSTALVKQIISEIKERNQREIIAKLVADLRTRNNRMAAAIEVNEPEVGVFWILPNKDLLKFSVPLSQGIDYGQFIVGTTDHFRIWEEMRAYLPASVKTKEYDEVPRGRVSFLKKEKFYTLLGSTSMMNNSDEVKLVIDKFKLKGQKLKKQSDEHYEPQEESSVAWMRNQLQEG